MVSETLFPRTRRAACGLRLLACALAALAFSWAHGDDNLQVKNEIRAAFIYNIARFVSWPEAALAQAQPSIQLCFFRYNDLDSATATIEGKELHGHPLATITIDNLAESGGCRLLVVPADTLVQFGEQARGTDLSHTLTITDLSRSAQGFPRHRAIMVTIVRKNTSLGLEVDLRAVNASNLKVSSELLKLATIVGRDS